MSCPDCFRGGVATGDPKGTIENLYGLPTYVAGPAPTTSSGSTIIYFCDAFGLKLVNNKLLADAYAAGTGMRVLVPDIIPGGPCEPSIMPLLDTFADPVAWYDVPGQLTRIVNFFRIMFYMGPFMYRALPSAKTSFAPCLEYARKVRADLPPGAKLGVAGFCWGGYQSINLCSLPAVEGGSERLIDAEFCAHPSRLKLPDDVVNAVMTFKTPVAIGHAGKDFALPTEEMDKTEAAVRQKAGNGEGENGYYYQIKTYEGVPHGFAVRARPNNEVDSKAADDAKEQAIQWFKRWL